MVVSFFGHAELYNSAELEPKLLSLLRTELEDEEYDLYFGGYGAFDALAHKCCRKLCAENKGKKMRFFYITPYLSDEHLRRCVTEGNMDYDEIIYPSIEKVPLRFAISARNKWIVEKSDLVISFVSKSYGGAYSAVKYAMRKGVRIINLGDFVV